MKLNAQLSEVWHQEYVKNLSETVHVKSGRRYRIIRSVTWGAWHRLDVVIWSGILYNAYIIQFLVIFIFSRSDYSLCSDWWGNPDLGLWSQTPFQCVRSEKKWTFCEICTNDYCMAVDTYKQFIGPLFFPMWCSHNRNISAMILKRYIYIYRPTIQCLDNYVRNSK